MADEAMGKDVIVQVWNDDQLKPPRAHQSQRCSHVLGCTGQKGSIGALWTWCRCNHGLLLVTDSKLGKKLGVFGKSAAVVVRSRAAGRRVMRSWSLLIAGSTDRAKGCLLMLRGGFWLKTSVLIDLV